MDMDTTNDDIYIIHDRKMWTWIDKKTRTKRNIYIKNQFV